MTIKAIQLKSEISSTEVKIALYRYEMEELLYKYYRNKQNWYEISECLDNILKNLDTEKARLKQLKKDFIMIYNG